MVNLLGWRRKSFEKEGSYKNAEESILDSRTYWGLEGNLTTSHCQKLVCYKMLQMLDVLNAVMNPSVSCKPSEHISALMHEVSDDRLIAVVGI
jgi:hypothetical protein